MITHVLKLSTDLNLILNEDQCCCSERIELNSKALVILYTLLLINGILFYMYITLKQACTLTTGVVGNGKA